MSAWAGTRALALVLAVSPTAAVASPGSEGARLYHARSCDTCHTTDGSKSVGPTFKHLYGSRVHLSDGRTVRATERYLRQSIEHPRATVVDGFRPQMPDVKLPANEVSALVAYIKTLK